MAKASSFLPKEHGAYAELAFPLVTGLALGGIPSLPSLALGSAGVAFFLANEPVAILLGTRGKRLQEQLGEGARKRGGALLGAGTLLGLAGVLGAGPAVWPVILIPVLTGLLFMPLVLAGRHKSVGGELLVVTAFTTLLLPLAAASGTEGGLAIAATGVWWISFALGTLEVHAIKARHKNTGRSAWSRWASPAACGITVLWAMGTVFGLFGSPPESGSPGEATLFPSFAGGLDWAWISDAAPHLAHAAQAILPPAISVLVLSLARIHPRHLKRVGWTLVGANSVAFLLLLRG
jgi:hypothetical protein